MPPEFDQPPAVSLEYEPAERAAARRRRRHGRRAMVALLLLIAVGLVAANRRSIQAKFARWQRDRALARAMARPVEERFPEGQVAYAVPPGFYSRSIPPPKTVYGPLTASSAAAAAELKDVGGWALGRPLVFLGTLTDSAGGRALVGIAFSSASVRWELVTPRPDYRSGYYLSLEYATAGSGRLSGVGRLGGTWMADLSALDWDYKWQDGHAAALPLTFYGGHVDPADPRVAVIPIRLGERRGRLRFWFGSTFADVSAVKTEVVWDP